MRLIADGGSTKVEWQLCRGEKVLARFKGPGVNPLVMGEEEVTSRIRESLRQHPESLEARHVEYYGAGCKGAGKALMESCLHGIFGAGRRVSVGSDMEGAATALLGNRPGIACILGTGANSCLWDGFRIVANTPPLGYILGDEGSGTWLGKLLIGDYLKGVMPRELAVRFRETYPHLNEGEVIRRVYRPAEGDDTPNRFLASLVPFIKENEGHRYMQAIVKEGFDAFVRRNLTPYLHPDNLVKAGINDTINLTVNFVGGIAANFRGELEEVLRGHRLQPGAIMATPLGK